MGARRLGVLRVASAVTLTLTAGVAWAQVNLGFELDVEPDALAETAHVTVPGWHVRGDATGFVIDEAVALSGRRSLRVDVREADERSGFEQEFDARTIAGDRLRISTYVKIAADASVAPSVRVRVDGGGRLLYIARMSATGEADASGWRQIVVETPLSPRAERIGIRADVAGQGVLWFDDFSLEPLATHALPSASAEAERYVGRALAIIEANAVTRAALEWPVFRERVMQQARGAVTVTDAHLAVQFALAELGDGHSYFMSPRQMSRLDTEPLGNARSGRQAWPPEARILLDGIGYLRLPGIAGGEHLDRVAYAESVQALIGGHAAGVTTGWILDLRGNEGGNVWPMLAGVGPLLGNGELGASVRPDGERRQIWYSDGKVGLGDYVQLRVRSEPVRVDGGLPVAVLLDSETASAAEIVALAFAGRPGARSFGSATVGATAATRTFPLSDGAALMLAVASVAGRDGRIVDGPIVPDEPVADLPGDDTPLDAQPVVVAARRWLEENR